MLDYDIRSPTSQKTDFLRHLLILFGMGMWLLLGCLDITSYSWDLPDSIRFEAERYWFHMFFGVIPGGILILYIPFFTSVSLLRGKRQYPRSILWGIVGMSILYRVVLLPSIPILETDQYRYLWDGRVVLMGENPYQFSPEEVEAGLHALRSETLNADTPEELTRIINVLQDDGLHQEIISHINNKVVPTLYFPMAQFFFAAGDLLILGVLPSDVSLDKDWNVVAGHAQIVWKLVLLPFDIGILLLIVSLLRKLGLADTWVLVYGWCPLVLKEYANTGHYDPIVIFFGLAAIRVLLSVSASGSKQPSDNPTGEMWRRVWGGCLLGLGIGCKLYPVFFVPILWKRLRLAGCAAIAVVLIVVYTPFVSVGTRLFTGLATYSDRWEFNSGFAAFTEWTVSKAQDWFRANGGTASDGADRGPMFSFSGVEFDLDAFFIAKAICGLIMIGTMGWLSWRSNWSKVAAHREDRSIVWACFVMVGTLLLASPVTDPWYVCWIVPFLCFFPNRAWLLLTCLQQIYYLYFWNNWSYFTISDISWYKWTSEFEIARATEYGPFYLLLVWEWWASSNRKEKAE